MYNVYMTPEDFLRSITPNDLQPAEYGLDKFMNITLEVGVGWVGLCRGRVSLEMGMVWVWSGWGCVCGCYSNVVFVLIL